MVNGEFRIERRKVTFNGMTSTSHFQFVHFIEERQILSLSIVGFLTNVFKTHNRRHLF